MGRSVISLIALMTLLIKKGMTISNPILYAPTPFTEQVSLTSLFNLSRLSTSQLGMIDFLSFIMVIALPTLQDFSSIPLFFQAHLLRCISFLELRQLMK